MGLINKIILFTDYPSNSLSIDQLKSNLNNLGFSIISRGNIYDFLDLDEYELINISSIFAQTLITDISEEITNLSNPINEASKQHVLLRGSNKNHKTLYDGFWLQRIFHNILFNKIPEECTDQHLHIIITSRLICTYEVKRYHARVVLTGCPALISTSGIVEAPARPREYYLLKASFLQSGKDLEELDEIYKGKFIKYDDERITDIVSSYIFQPILYKFSGTSFCEDDSCCQYNSHWHEEVIRLQQKGRFCSNCKSMLDSIRNLN